MGHQLDDIDRHILEVLQSDGRIPNQTLADTVGLSPSACHRRVRHLEDRGIVAGYVAVVDPEALGYHSRVFVTVSLARQEQQTLEAFERAVTACREVRSCHLLSGETDYLLDVAVADMEDFERLHRQRLSRLPGVSRLRIAFVIRTVADRTSYQMRG